jgi:hypothetical protein
MIAYSQEALSQEVRTSDPAHPRLRRAVNSPTTSPRSAERGLPAWGEYLSGMEFGGRSESITTTSQDESTTVP